MLYFFILEGQGAAEASEANEPAAVRATCVCSFNNHLANSCLCHQVGLDCISSGPGAVYGCQSCFHLFNRRKKWLAIARAASISLAIIHFSYGLGFLIGLVKFANRWNDKTGKVPPWHI